MLYHILMLFTGPGTDETLTGLPTSSQFQRALFTWELCSITCAHGGPGCPANVWWNYSACLFFSPQIHLTLVSRTQYIQNLISHYFQGYHLDLGDHHLLPELC